VPFTSIIDRQAFLVFQHDEGSDERWQLSWLEQIGGVSRPPRTPARNHVEVGARERLVHEHAARLQRIGKHLEQRTIEKADAYDRVARSFRERERARISHDPEDAFMSSNRCRYGAVHEVDDYHSFPAPRDGLCVTARAASEVDDHSVVRQRRASLDHPRRRRTVKLTPALAVPPVPFRAVAARIESSAH